MKENWIKNHLEQLEQRGDLRKISPLHPVEGQKRVQRDKDGKAAGRSLLNLCSNDYLGLSTKGKLLQDFYRDLLKKGSYEKYIPGNYSSRLLSGDNIIFHELEAHLGALFNKSVLLFNSGYHGNIGIIPSITGKNDLILSDKLNHASIHDGVRLSYSKVKRYQHLDYDQIERILCKQRNKYENVVIISESVYSMDGDCADLSRLVEIKNRHNCLLYIDDAHGFGMYGEHGLGKVEEAGLISEVDILTATFGKAIGGGGGFAVTSSEMKSFLINSARSLIFTTAMVPVTAAWNLFIIQQLNSFSDIRNKVVDISGMLVEKMNSAGVGIKSETNIIPFLVGDNKKLLHISNKLQDNGFFVKPIRSPSVPVGTERLRISLTGAMEWEDIQELPLLLKEGMSCEN